MQLSSALAKEVVSTDLLSKVEENIVPGLKGLEVQFVPSTTLQGISESDIGNLQFGHLLPFQVVLTFSTSTSMDDMKLITCVLTSNHMSEVESLKQILTVVVKKDQVVVDHRIEEEKSDHSTKLKVVFVAKCGGKYSVSASMYGEMVQGSPMVVEVAQGVSARLPKVEDVMNNVKFVNDDDVSEMKEKSSLNDVKEAAVESKAINRKFDDLNEGEVKNCDVAVTFKGDGARAAIEDLSKTETGKAATDDLTVDVDETKANECRLNPSLEPEVSPLSKALDVPPSKAVSAPVFSVGSSCLVRWDEDKVWCRARVDNYVQGIYEVTFVDYGNKETVGIEDMVHRTDDIPADQLEMTDPLVWKWFVGMTCVAKWSEDKTWYNGVVSGVGGGQYTVMFVDYGNIEVVSEENIVESAKNIPAEERENVDICVIMEPDGNVETDDVIDVAHADPQALPENIIDIKDMSDDSCANPQISQPVVELAAVKENTLEAAQCTATQEDDNLVAALSRRFDVGSFCIAEWAEDSTWYNGLVIMANRDGSYQVEFVDYGNTENVIEEKMVEAVEDVPVESCLDEFVKTVQGEVAVDEKSNDLGSPELEEAVVIEELINGDVTKNDAAAIVVEEKDTAEVVVKSILREESEQVFNIGSPPKEVNTMPGQDDDAPWTPSVGSVCCAKWSDRVWYNARVDEVLRGGKEVLVTFIDYGNTDKVPVRKLVKNHSLIPEGAKINTLVKKESPAVAQDDNEDLVNVISEDPLSSSTPIQDGLSVGEECVALWAEDNVWYNARIIMIDQQAKVAEVEFFDYGNADLVSLGDVFRKFSSVPLARPGEEITVDPNVYTGQGEEVDLGVDDSVLIRQDQGDLLVEPSAQTDHGVKAEPVSLLSLVTKDQHGKIILNAVVVNTITTMEGVVGMTILPGGTLVTAVEKENTVKMWSRDGQCTGEVVGDREFIHPSDVVCVGGTGFAVKDKKGIMMFDMQGKFVRNLEVDKLDTCSGMAVDNLGRIVIINRCGEGDEGKLTLRGETDILYIDIMKEKVVKRVEMVDIIAEREKTICKALTMYKDKLYVVDNGLDCVYTLFHEDGEDQAEVFGSPGRREAQFSGVSAVVLDDQGNSVISDTRNNRLQLFSSEWEFVGFVKVIL